MNTKKSRQVFNLAIVKKGSRFDIVRYSNGFDREPVTILKNLNKTEINAKFQRAIKLIASTMSLFSVFIRPYDKNQLVELVLMLEDSGITQEDIKIQTNGLVFFQMQGDDDKSVRESIESLLRENNFEYDSSMITVARGDAMVPAQEKKAEVKDMGFESKPTDTVYLQTNKEDVDTQISPLSKEDQETLDTIKMYPELLSNPELKAKYEELIKKVGTTIQPSPSIDASDIDPIKTVEPKINKAEQFLTSTTSKFSSGEELVQAMVDNGISVEEIKECYKNKPELLKSVLQ